MGLLKYDYTTNRKRKYSPTQQAAIYDFIVGEASCRQAAKVVEVSQQGIYSVATNHIRKWIENGLIDTSKLIEYLNNKMKDDEQYGK